MNTSEALRGAIRACAGLVDPAPLEEALRILVEPVTLAVVGRVAAGKSTLVSWLADTRRPVGLGGVTQALDRVPSPLGVLVDTPGIDDTDAAMLGLDDVLAEADGVLWVVDGLQPLTASERDVLAATLPPGRPVWIVVSKADLIDPAEVDSVIARIRDLTAAHAPVSIEALDLRSAAREGRSARALGRLDGPGPRRVARVEAALAAVRAALGRIPTPPTPDELRETWRDAVRAAAREVEEEVARGALPDRSAALQALGERAPAVFAAIARRCAPVAPPPLPTPSAPAGPMSGVVAGLTGGMEGARRAVRAEAARWLAEGELVLSEPWPGAEILRTARARRDRLLRALGAVADGLSPRSPARAG